jgi:hypothetical protein
MLAQGTAARFKFTLHPYYCWSLLSASCLLHEISKRHLTRCCWPWRFRAWRGRYGSFPRGWAVISVRPYWLRCVSAPRSSFVIRRPLSAPGQGFLLPARSQISLRFYGPSRCTIAQSRKTLIEPSSHAQSQTAIAGSFTDCTCPVELARKTGSGSELARNSSAELSSQDRIISCDLLC